MRILLAGALAALCLGGVAFAQDTTNAGTVTGASACGEAPARPTLPDGAAANRAAMDAANTAYTAWSQAYHANLTCRRTEADNARATWQARVAEYNAAATALNESNTSWEAEVAEYNGRSGSTETQVDVPPAGSRRPRQSN